MGVGASCIDITLLVLLWNFTAVEFTIYCFEQATQDRDCLDLDIVP